MERTNSDKIEELENVESFHQNNDLEKVDIEMLPATIEALMLAYGEPLPSELICQTTKASEEEVRMALTQLATKYENDDSGIFLAEINNKYQLRTKSQYSNYIQVVKSGKPRRLSPAALETLAIIAYRQPVVKSDIEKIRGVDVSPTLKTLLDRRLIKIIGHQATVGQPALYGTTDEFLNIFGLSSLEDLPNLRDLEEVEGDPGENAEEYTSQTEEESLSKHL